MVTVGSFHAGTKTTSSPTMPSSQLTVRSYTPEVRKLLLDGIRRIARGEAIAAGLPDDRMPIVEIEQPSADATFNTAPFSDHLLALFSAHFGADRVVQPKPIMAARTSAATGSPTRASRARSSGSAACPRPNGTRPRATRNKLPSLHSPFWAPDAETVISTATEAMTVAALDMLKKG